MLPKLKEKNVLHIAYILKLLEEIPIVTNVAAQITEKLLHKYLDAIEIKGNT